LTSAAPSPYVTIVTSSTFTRPLAISMSASGSG
jgi:hypothetical protein